MNNIRFVTAASLFDGHDVSINIMRRILQSKGVEVIHLGHNRSAEDVVNAALCEDVQAIALSSYQGGHVEYFSYIRELLNKNGAQNIKIFGGGGGVITPKEIKFLHSKGITRIYSPEDGMNLGLEGIVEDMIKQSDFSTIENLTFKDNKLNDYQISKAITFIENTNKVPENLITQNKKQSIPVLGVTGTGGAGKSSLIDEILLRLHKHFSSKRIALISVDPTKKRTKGALLGDRIRLGAASFNQFYIRSLATRNSNTELSPQISNVVSFLKSQDFDLIIVETSGIGQASDAITNIADQCLYVMTGEFGAQSQLEKIEMLDSADYIVINKFEKARSEDAYRDVCKQVKRNLKQFDIDNSKLNVFGTIASRFNDSGVNRLFLKILEKLEWNSQLDLNTDIELNKKNTIIPPEQSLYLRTISSVVKKYNTEAKNISVLLENYNSLIKAQEILGDSNDISKDIEKQRSNIPDDVFDKIKLFNQSIKDYSNGSFSYDVRGKKIEVQTKYKSLSNNSISKVAVPRNLHIDQKYKFIQNENLPGHFPFSNGIFPFKRKDEDPKRMFAGVGGPKRTNKRFHFLSKDDPAKRLSTAFDSATLYGEDPDLRPDIFGKIGEAGVSIATLDDMQDLFDGFDLIAPQTSVSMTINGPASIILAMFMNTAIKQQSSSEKDFWDIKKRIDIMRNVRGTVQADILKEDQAQNTCIFSLDFALKLMGDVQEYFCKNMIKNYYTVSISGYHIAEAGANPITQLAFTLANGFTYVEYYLSRGLKIDEFAENLSFFFSNGLDPEYSVLGRVARKIWAITLRDKYKANLKSQKFKYHIQTSGRSLHAQEIDFNDIRTTLQAFLALSDNCNSLHTNAYDEAITTPTEESVRRAMAIQMIINREFGLNKTDNPLQGSYLINELCEIVEEAVLKEFEIISDKGGVLGAMESMYQRSQIQDESHLYESQKDSGELPIIGVNTYINPDVSKQLNKEIDLSRCDDEEKNNQIKRLNNFKEKNIEKSQIALSRLMEVALKDENIFEELLTTVNYCSLGEITNALYKVGGKYRRNM